MPPWSPGANVAMRFVSIASAIVAFIAVRPSESIESVCLNSRSVDGASVTSCKGGVPSNSKSAVGRAMLQTGKVEMTPISVVKTESQVLQSDLSQFDRSLYLRFDSSQPVMKNADNSFEHFIAAAGLFAELDDREKIAFKQRFLAMIKESVEEDPLAILSNESTEKDASWARIIGKTLEDEKPVASIRGITLLNRGNLSWVAAGHDWMVNTSARDLRKMCGARVSQESQDKLAEDQRRKELGLIDVNEGVNEAHPDQFDSRDYWPMCAETIAHVRDQGQCGDCWAMTAAKIIESHLCIASNGTFSGPSGHISAGYLASCANPDGCSGGCVDQALSWASAHGVPTGGQGLTSQTCIPYFARGSSLQHFHGASHSTPDCPKQCTNKLYARSLKQDLFRPVGIEYTFPTSSFEHAKRAIYNSGPIGMGLKVWSDFLAYTSGIYKHASTSQYMGMHATTAIGFGLDHIIGVNSWNTRWGMEGLFKVHNSEILLYWCPGAIAGGGNGYPYPLPGGPKQADIVASFKSGSRYVGRNLPGHKASVEVSALACHHRCEMTPACASFSYWYDVARPGRCELHDNMASRVQELNVMSGLAKPDGDFPTETPTTSEEASSADCWRAPSACAPEFDWKSVTYEGCSLAGSNGTGWCCYESDCNTEAGWSWCLWNCVDGGSTTTMTTARRYQQ
eukprot:TRINITY_DN4496_c0_g2_i1.p1 TRINITY_DN4496_c0_g2~~TRINITY_DN4496_c0_g2_i1.p1  ORF type:complete len:680 (+),score=71.76 TRINITY_DN4496_c0_g2_i1:75-2114(+)